MSKKSVFIFITFAVLILFVCLFFMLDFSFAVESQGAVLVTGVNESKIEIDDNSDYALEKLNSITVSQLAGINKIGRETANNIVIYREDNQRFHSFAELYNVLDMTDEKYEALAKHFDILTEYNGKINLNTASHSTLCDIEGVSGELARYIVEYRIMYGEFERVDELIKSGTVSQDDYDRIKDKFFV